VHLPDGFLSAPVWAALDAAAIPAVGIAVRRAQNRFDESRIPLLGVMGAFVFAAQMVNFPVGPGTSGHLVGGALLVFTLGPAAAAVVMSAILAIQALVFQDGGVLALGANIVNMAMLGSVTAYLPFRLWGSGRRRRFALFLGGSLSVLVAAVLAVSELLVSGVRMPGPVLGVSLGLFLVAAVAEGVITVAVVQALESIQPGFIRQPAPGRSFALGSLSLLAVVLAAAGTLFASTNPDGLEKLAAQIGIAARQKVMVAAPLAEYQSDWLGQTGAGLAGLVMIYAACLLLGRLVSRNRSV
jgi:cobalt/nickel transport system permease protein